MTGDLLERREWSDEDVARAFPITDTGFLTIGGGLGSLATVAFLRVAGVAPDAITVASPLARPDETYRALAEASQIAAEDPLRSDSGSRADGVWGFPGYAVEDAWRRRSARPLWRVATEPVLSEYYTPRLGPLCDGVGREADRIGWDEMLAPGRVQVVRPRTGGGYFALFSRAGGDDRPALAFRARHVHLALGYPALRLLPQLQEYRAASGDRSRAVHVYEPHDHVYAALRNRDGVVIVRGAGIAASRVLERLIDDRDQTGRVTEILHLFRAYVPGPSGPPWFRRPGGEGFLYQPFNFPKGAFGGQLAPKVAALEPSARAAYLATIGGTTTAKRKRWRRQLARGRREGWYRAHVGEVVAVHPSGDHRVEIEIRSVDDMVVRVPADFVVDATGFEPDSCGHPLIRDLVARTGASLNPLGRLDVDRHFEVRGARSGDGRLYASGPITMGGPVAPVDSFWGLNLAAIEIADDLARLGFCGRVGTGRSLRGWWRWARGQAP